MLRISTFNVNGIRAAHRRGFLEWYAARSPDVIALQEVRCPLGALPEGAFAGMQAAYDPGTLAGRNGVAVLTRVPPAAVRAWGPTTHLLAPDGMIGTSNAVSAPRVRLRFDAPAMLVMLPSIKRLTTVQSTLQRGIAAADELFEVLTLVQTGNVARLPIVLVGKEFWSRAIDFEYLQNEGFIDSQDEQLITRVDTADEAVSVIQSFYGGRPPAPDSDRD